MARRATALFLACLVLTLAVVVTNDGRTRADASGVRATALKPVEDDLHEFMEYAFQPVFAELKQSLSSTPTDRKAWVPVKSNALILAENGNLLMLRPPEENQAEWHRLSTELREAGRLLYQAAKKRDYTMTRDRYVAMINKCNACHDEFAEGEYQQEP